MKSPISCQKIRQAGTQIRAQDFQTLENVLQETADRIKAASGDDDG